MRGIAIALIITTTGCYSPTPPSGAPCSIDSACPSGQACVAGICGGSATDATIEVTVDAPTDASACTTWTARHFDPCAVPAPVGDLNLTQALSGYSWNTDEPALTGKMNTPVEVATTVLTQVGGPDVLLASVENLTMDAATYLNVSGERGLVIAVSGTATINGVIDVRASFSGEGPGGYGGLSAECGSDPTGDFGAQGIPSTGGGGGGFQGDGGMGGGNVPAGTAIPIPTIVRGGCAGGAGGASSTSVMGTRGAGGGALQISARVAIVIGANGAITAGGGAGSYGRANYGGGGGGGSGGYIGLQAPMLTIAGTLAANGGGGGGGASDVAQGSSGTNGATSGTAASGGPGATTTNIGVCGSGGAGSSGGTLNAQPGVATACGGSGGGGGAGYILFWSPTTDVTGTVSPVAVSGPT